MVCNICNVVTQHIIYACKQDPRILHSDIAHGTCYITCRENNIKSRLHNRQIIGRHSVGPCPRLPQPRGPLPMSSPAPRWADTRGFPPFRVRRTKASTSHRSASAAGAPAAAGTPVAASTGWRAGAPAATLGLSHRFQFIP